MRGLSFFSCLPKATWLVGLLAAALAPQTIRAAGPFTVNTTSDTHAVTPASSPNDSTAHISLRSAIEAANAQAGATIINVPAGTYNLALGELGVAPNGAKTNSILGAGALTTIVSQTDPSNRVFNIDFNSSGSTIVTLAGLTVQGGHDGADKLGGAGILAGSVTSPIKDVITLSNCIVQNNRCTTNTTQQPGGGVQMAGGDLKIIGCTFSNNSSGQSFGAAVFVLAQTVVSSLTASNSTFVGNTLTNNSGAGPDGGGAIYIATPSNSVHTITGCTFTSNVVVGLSGNTYGGAIHLNSGIMNVAASTFVGNLAIGQGGLGGAFYVDSGTVSIGLSRLAANFATHGGSGVYNHGLNGAITTATNDWWGCDGVPLGTGCNSAAGDGGNLTFSPWLFLTNTASPSTITPGQSTTLTASILKNSANQTLPLSQLSVLIGLPIVWNSAGANGFVTPIHTTIQPSGLANATFTQDGTCNTGLPGVTLDGGTSVATVVVQCPDLTVTKTNNVAGSASLGNSWTWTVHVVNAGSLQANFTNGATLLLDNLPTANIGYSAPSVANISGVAGSLIPSLDASGNLTVKASSVLTLNSGGSFDALLTATPTSLGIYGNPRAGGVCAVDPNNSSMEISKANNAATNAVTVTCPNVVGTMGGGGTVCLGNSAMVSVSISGGKAPYTVTLSNGGGTQTGGGLLFFTVTPTSNTTYQVSSGTDSNSCPIANNGSASVNISVVTNPPIALQPATVMANSSGNQASGPSGYSSYSWVIGNGSIVGPTNQQTVSYVAGVSNSVVLGLTVVNSFGCTAASSTSAPIVTGFSVHTNVTMLDTLNSIVMGIACDGTNYWTVSGGSPSGVRLGRYSSSGVLQATYSPGFDFRSIFSTANGTVMARYLTNRTLLRQTTPGVFINSVTLSGGTLDDQAQVILNGAGNEYQAMTAGVVSRWSTNGTYLGSVNLAGFGSISNENLYPQNRGIAAYSNFWLTYNGSNVLSIWDSSGNRLAQVMLVGSGTGFDASFSFSFCNGKVFIADISGGLWRGFDLYTAASAIVLAAEQNAPLNTDVVSKISGVRFLPKVDFLRVDSTNPLPTLNQLRGYQSVMFYSDSTVNDSIGMGNVLADYLDQGGGVLVNTFAFATNGNYALLGRVSTGGYLPFTQAGYTTPASLSLIKDLPLHPLLDGVNSFVGGSMSFQNSPVAAAAGATLVGHWSNGQPFVAGKDVPPGRTAGLNFFPPSVDSYPPGWVSSSDGARLMANALVWVGKIPPTLLRAPSDQVSRVSGTASFSAVAVGIAPLSYQWRLNGTNLPGMTGTSLSFTVQPTSYGIYSVVVSNLLGTTTSLNASLAPPLRLLTPNPIGGNFSLFLAAANGSTVVTNRASRVSIYSTTNLSLPFSAWTLQPNLVYPSAGLLRADGFSTSGSASQFYRAVEAP